MQFMIPAVEEAKAALVRAMREWLLSTFMWKLINHRNLSMRSLFEASYKKVLNIGNSFIRNTLSTVNDNL